MAQDRPLSTADLARTDDVRGHHEEDARGFDPSVEPMNRPNAAAGGQATESPADRPRGDQPNAPRVDAAQHAPLFAEHDLAGLRSRWSDVQAGFVDEPRRAVEQADSLVAEVMKRLAESFANERASLERQWDRGDNVTTEDLRLALQRYRSFFDRLLTV